jgi:hypothetical protein
MFRDSLSSQSRQTRDSWKEGEGEWRKMRPMGRGILEGGRERHVTQEKRLR